MTNKTSKEELHAQALKAHNEAVDQARTAFHDACGAPWAEFEKAKKQAEETYLFTMVRGE